MKERTEQQLTAENEQPGEADHRQPAQLTPEEARCAHANLPVFEHKEPQANPTLTKARDKLWDIGYGDEYGKSK